MPAAVGLCSCDEGCYRARPLRSGEPKCCLASEQRSLQITCVQGIVKTLMAEFLYSNFVMGFIPKSIALRFLRLAEGLESNGDSRTGARERLAVVSAITAAVAKLVTVATMLVSVPITLRYLGPERYGLWTAMSSAVYVLSFSDLGIGNSLLNIVADAFGRDDRRTIREAVSTTTLMFCAVAFCIGAAFSMLYIFAPWSAWFNVQSEAAKAEIGPSLAVLVACFALSIPFSVTARLQTALQRGYRANLWTAFGSLLSLMGVLLAIRCEAGLPWLSLAFAGAPLLAALINGVVYFSGEGRDFRPNIKTVSSTLSRRIVASGAAFLGIQIIVAVNVASDNVIIAHMLGPEAVTTFSVPERMFGLVPILIHLALQPLWPAYAEALARKDHDWIKRTLRQSFLLALAVSSACSLVLLAGGRWIVETWTSGVIHPPAMLLAGFGLWKIVDSIEFALTIFLASANILKPQLIFGFCAMSAALLSKLSFIATFGIDIVPWASGLARLSISLTPLLIITHFKQKTPDEM